MTSERINSEIISSHEADGDLRIIDFTEYRLLCDATNGFRRVGIQDQESYEAISQDERTVFADYADYRIPLLAPVEYEKMYDEQRCQMMSGKQDVLLLAIPLDRLEAMPPETDYAINDDTIVIVEEFVPTDRKVELGGHDISNLPFTNAKPFDFVNPDLLGKYPGHESAWMAAYRFDMEPEGGASKVYEGQALSGEFIQAWQEICVENNRPLLPTENSTGTFVLSAEQLAERPDVVDQLWEISEVGFGKVLGAHHPVSMEFNKQFFDKQIVASNTVTGIHCVDGEVVCFGFIGLDMTNNEWLNEKSDAIQNEANRAQAANRPLVHFHELIGKGQKGMGYSGAIFNTFFDIAAKTGYSYSVFFESTTLSSLYIPPHITRSLNRSDKMTMTSDIETIGKLSYWALVANDEADSDRLA